MTYFYSNQAGCYIVAILFLVLCTVGVCWRFYLRKQQQLPLRLDDWLCIPALIFTVGVSITIIVGTAKGAFGISADTATIRSNSIQFSQAQELNSKCAFAVVVLSYFGLGFIKLSFLFFFRHIFRGRPFDIVSWVTIIAVTLWMVISSFLYIGGCGSHVDYLWSSYTKLQTCVNIFNQNLAGSVIDVFFDLLLLVIPLVMILKMHMPRKTTIAGCSVFLVAAISIGAGICRLVITASLEDVNDLKGHSSILGVPSEDKVALTSIQVFWTMIELGVGLIAACLPCIGLFPLLHRILSALRLRLGLTSGDDEEEMTTTLAERSNQLEKKRNPERRDPDEELLRPYRSAELDGPQISEKDASPVVVEKDASAEILEKDATSAPVEKDATPLGKDDDGGKRRSSITKQTSQHSVRAELE